MRILVTGAGGQVGGRVAPNLRHHDVVALTRTACVRPQVLSYINRTSDLLFVLARAVNAAAGVADVPWKKR